MAVPGGTGGLGEGRGSEVGSPKSWQGGRGYRQAGGHLASPLHTAGAAALD